MAEASDVLSGPPAADDRSASADRQAMLERVLSVVNSAPVVIYLAARNNELFWLARFESAGVDPRETVSRWRPDFQRDFARRMAWCVAEAK